MDTDSDDASTQPHSFDRLVVDSPSTSATKTTTSETQALINRKILQQLSSIGEKLDKIEQNQLKRR